MAPNETKIVVVSKEGGLARVGNDIIELQDETRESFKTDDIDSFKKYIMAFATKYEKPVFALYYDAGEIVAMPSEGFQQHTVPIAELKLLQAEALTRFISAFRNQMDINSFESFLLEFRPFMDQSALTLLSHIRDLRIEKITQITRQKDNKGNFNYSVTRKSAGRGDFAPPEKLSFELPVYEGIDCTFKTKAELVFDFVEGEGEEKPDYKLCFSIRNFQISEELRVAQKQIMEDQLKPFPQKKYWGNIRICVFTDAWKYMKNELR